MASSKKQPNVVDMVSVGRPPLKKGRTSETLMFFIHNFKDRHEKRGEYIVSPILEAHGHQWQIVVYPRGSLDSPTIGEYTGCYLLLKGSVVPVTVSYKFWTVFGTHTDQNILFQPNIQPWGFDVIRQDSRLFQSGGLLIQCDVELDEKNKRSVWYPKKLQPEPTLMSLYGDKSSSDVTFSVGGTVYFVHKKVISLHCKKLYELAERADKNSTLPFAVPLVSNSTFESMLKFAYTIERTPEMDSKETAIEILKAAKLYDFVLLKLYAESVLVEKFLKTESAAELLLFSDYHKCALLKEAATEWVLSNIEAVQKTPDWSKVEESKLSNELLRVSTKRNSTATSDDNNIDQMDVATLRERLEQANQELDGTREDLVNRWETFLLQRRNAATPETIPPGDRKRTAAAIN